MKIRELEILNALLAENLSRTLPVEQLTELTDRLAGLIGCDRVVLYLSRPGEGKTTLAAETKSPGAEPSPSIFSPDTKISDLLCKDTTRKACRINDPGQCHSAWAGYSQLILAPFSFSARDGLVLFLDGTPESGKALGLPFFNDLGETLGLIFDNLARQALAMEEMKDLQFLQEVGQALHAILDLGKLLPLVSRKIFEYFGLESVNIFLAEGSEEGKTFQRYSWPNAPDQKCPPEFLDKIHNQTMAKGEMVLDFPCPFAEPDEDGQPPILITASPLFCSRHKKLIGTTIFRHHQNLFSRDNPLYLSDRKTFLSSLSSQISLAAANAIHFMESCRLAAENDSRIKELSILFEVSQVLAGTMRLEETLKIILTAATIGHGLGFNRAALFLIDEVTNTLRGSLGIAPADASEAFRIWDELATKDWNLSEALKISGRSTFTSQFEETIKSVNLPIEPGPGILTRCVLENRAFNITNAIEEKGINTVLAGKIEATAFAVAPLATEGKVLGAISVDNFYNNRPITEEDLQLLSTFASSAALAIHNAQLYDRLQKTHRELKSMYRRLSRSERLAALGEMAATIAHEVRNPLVTIGGFTRRMEKRLEVNDPNKKFTEIILKELSRLENFLNDVLAFSREVAPKPSPICLNTIIREMAEFHGEELEKKDIKLKMDLEAGLPKIEADAEHISQILMNLFANSMEAMETGGKITVQTYSAGKEGSVYLRFSDTGGGVPEEVLAKIFIPFFTTKVKGTGLGLPLIQKMIRSHGGSIQVENKPGQSVSFLVNLPINAMEEKNEQDTGR